MCAQWTTDSVTQHTQELLRQLGPVLVTSGAGHNAGQLLLYLEELDLISDDTQLLQTLQAVAESQVGGLIRRTVQSLPPPGPTTRAVCEQLGSQALAKLTTLPAVRQLRIRLSQVTEAAAAEMLENVDELRDVLAEPAAAAPRDGPVDPLSRSIGSSLYGSLNPSLVFSPEDLDGLGPALDPEQDEGTRSDALSVLLTAVASASLGASTWARLRPAVQDALLDPADAVAGRAHQVHARLLVSESHVLIKEAYLSLLEVVCTVYVDRRRRAGPPHRGLNVNVTETKRALQIMAIVNQYQRYVPRAWLRFPERHVEEMAENTVDLLTLGVPRLGAASLADVCALPVALLCLVDPAAVWFRHWMHAEWGRQKLVVVLRKSPQLLQLMLSILLMHNTRAQPPVSGGGLLVAETVSAACYSHAVRVLVCVAQHRGCSSLFPVAARGREPVTLTELLRLLLDTACGGHGQVALSALCSALRHSPALQEAFGEQSLLSALADHLQRALPEGATQRRVPPPLCLLLALTGSAAGQRHLCSGRRHGSTHRGCGGLLARAICQTAPAALSTETSAGEAAAAFSLLLSQLCRSHLGLQTVVMSDLLQTLNERLRQLDPNLEQSSRGLTPLSAHVLPFCQSLLRYPRALCVMVREQLLSPTLRRLGDDTESAAALPSLLCLRRCTALLPPQAWFQRWCRAAAAQLSHPDAEVALSEPGAPHLDTAHTLYCWAACHWGAWLLLPARCPLPCDVTAPMLGRPAPAWVALLSLACCSHLDGRVQMAAYTKGEMRSGRQSPEVVDEAFLFAEHARELLASTETPTHTLIHQYLSLESARSRPAAAADSRRVLGGSRRPHELARFLADSRHSLHDAAWLSGCRRALKATLAAAPAQTIKEGQLAELLDQLLEVPAGTGELALPERCVQPAAAAVADDELPTATDAAAADLLLQYGSRQRLVAGSAAAGEALLAVLRHARRICAEPEADAECGVHWLAGIVFLVYGGNADRCRAFLSGYFSRPGSALVWAGRGNQVARQRDLCCDELLLSGLLHHVGALLEQEVPGVHAALQRGRLPLACLCGGWLRQCYLGVLPWSEVVHYLALVTCLGPDYALYFTVAVLRHSQSTLLAAAAAPLPLLSCQLSPVQGFRTAEHMNYMETLCRRYRRSIVSDLNACLNQYKWGYEV